MNDVDLEWIEECVPCFWYGDSSTFMPASVEMYIIFVGSIIFFVGSKPIKNVFWLKL